MRKSTGDDLPRRGLDGRSGTAIVPTEREIVRADAIPDHKRVAVDASRATKQPNGDIRRQSARIGQQPRAARHRHSRRYLLLLTLH